MCKITITHTSSRRCTLLLSVVVKVLAPITRRLNYSDFYFVGARASFYLDWHKLTSPFCFVFIFACGTLESSHSETAD